MLQRLYGKIKPLMNHQSCDLYEIHRAFIAFSDHSLHKVTGDMQDSFVMHVSIA